MKTYKNYKNEEQKENSRFYGKNYKPNKNAVPVEYKGTKYLSKAQCMALEGITRKELDEYLNPKEMEQINVPLDNELDALDL